MSLKLLRVPLLTLVILIAAAGATLAWHPEWIRVGSVRVDLAPESGEHLLYQRIKQALEPQFKRLEGSYFWQVPLESVYQTTAGDRRVRSLSVTREFPGALRVVIEPYTPVLAYLSRDGRVYPVATDATLLPALPTKDVPNLPFLRGDELRDEAKLRERALELYRAIPDEGAFAKGQVSEIVYGKKDGFRVFVGGPKVEVKLGESDFTAKASRVTKVLSYLDSQNIKGRVIDARFSKKVVVRVRKRP